jgi:hypothetical protein
MDDQERQLLEKFEDRDVVGVEMGGDCSMSSIRLKLDDGSDIWFVAGNAQIHILIGNSPTATIKAASVDVAAAD